MDTHPTKPTRPTKPTPPKTDHLDVLHDTLDAARQEVIDLCASLEDTDVLASWAVVPTVQAWQEAAEAWNEAVADAAVDVRGFMEEHSEKWQESERGQAYDAWATALEEAEIETEPLDMLRLTLTIDLTSGQIEGEVENAEETLPETPDVPELDA